MYPWPNERRRKGTLQIISNLNCREVQGRSTWLNTCQGVTCLQSWTITSFASATIKPRSLQLKPSRERFRLSVWTMVSIKARTVRASRLHLIRFVLQQLTNTYSSTNSLKTTDLKRIRESRKATSLLHIHCNYVNRISLSHILDWNENLIYIATKKAYIIMTKDSGKIL